MIATNMSRIMLIIALLMFNQKVKADSYQLYLPGNSSYVNGSLPANLQKLWIVNTDSNVVKEVSMTNYFSTTFPNNLPNIYSSQVDFMGSSRVAQDFVGNNLIIRDNDLVTLASLTTDITDPLFGQAFYYDRVVKINVNTGKLEEDYLVARSADALQVARDMGFEAVLADGAGDIIPGFNTLTLKTFSKNTTTSTGDQATQGGFYAEQITSSSGASLFRQEADGTVHIGENSIVLADELVSQSGNDEVYSSSGVLQLGNNENHKTLIKGSLSVEGELNINEPTEASHAATKRYVDKMGNDLVEYVDNTANELVKYVDHKELEIKKYIDQNYARKSYVEAGLAAVSAMSSIPTATNGESMIGVGVGSYGSKSSIAIGLSSHFPKHNFNIKANIGYASGGKAAMGVGAGFRFR